MTPKTSGTIALALAALCLAGPVAGADYSDPTWPCVQRKVERLSVGLMWPYPVPETMPDTVPQSARDDIAALGAKLAVRRIAPQDLAPDIASFAAAHGGDPALLGLVFADVFDSLSRRRARIIGGIGDFSLSQIALAEKIEEARGEMTAELKADAPDFDRIDALEEQLDWDQLIYSDRQKSITYLCETPTLLERRLFEIARMLQAEVDEG
ncbi:hypothetical protein DKT77_04775 [Meridianimarinicoccus roseus]|uniref:Uncharacterized protein n=1 Tax=Meridianimarinicoccus roseus TaxID=2072018 RepID=A0A2V2LEH0_9RHOB|nr:hypothetical protein [Meridianimarinicoccus roseus]PWR03825.1 hypothetical protein DKT77_04775 [Meridianimarinicoccus roseus]